MIKKIYKKIIEISKKKYALSFLLIIAFLESFIFPIPPDIFLIFLVLAHRNKAFYLASYCTVFSVAGGILGYFIGSFFFDSLGQGILNYYNLNDKFLAFSEGYSEHGALIVGAGGFTPIPYKIFTISAGAFDISFIVFAVASLISRSVRFFIIAALIYRFGEKIREFIDHYFNILTFIIIALIISGYLLTNYVIV